MFDASVRTNLEAVESERVTTPDPESTTMFPVVDPPKVRVCMLVVARLPAPVRKAALLPELAEMVAVGVPELTLRTANLAEVVAAPPMRRSTVELLG